MIDLARLSQILGVTIGEAAVIARAVQDATVDDQFTAAPSELKAEPAPPELTARPGWVIRDADGRVVGEYATDTPKRDVAELRRYADVHGITCHL